MWFRCRVYEVLPERLPVFNELFERHLFPIQRRHGATLVARIASVAGDRVVALWTYRSEAHLAEVQAAVAADPALPAAFAFRDSHGFPLYERCEEFGAETTVPLELTALAQGGAPSW